ncbi:metal-dependent transcriptional regulator [Natrialbaceae archaeon A-gly3]
MTGATQYLLVVYVAERRDGPPVPPGYVADVLDRSPAATTEMLGRLEDRGLVIAEPYQGVTLTPEGRDSAREAAETYRTLSRFFREVLGLEEPEREAMQVAGSVSPHVVDRLATTLLDGEVAESETDELTFLF